MHPSLGATAPVGLRVAGYNFTAASSRHCRLHSFPKLGGVSRELIDTFSIDMNVKQSRRASHMYIHVPCSDDLTRNTLPGQTFVTSPFKTVLLQKLLRRSIWVLFYQTYTDEKQIENSNIQLNIKIIMILVLKRTRLNGTYNFKYHDSHLR